MQRVLRFLCNLRAMTQVAAWVRGPPPELIEGHGFTLRKCTVADATIFYVVVECNLQHLEIWLPGVNFSKSVADAEVFLASCEHEWQSRESFRYNIFVGEMIAGCITLFNSRVGPFISEIGYWVGTAFLRRGIAKGAARLLTDAAFEYLGARSVSIIVAEHNLASHAVARSLGFTRLAEPYTDPTLALVDSEPPPPVLIHWSLQREAGRE